MVNPLSFDIQNRYAYYRTMKKNRSEAIVALKMEFAEELSDEQSKMLFMCALVSTLCKRKELTSEVAAETQAIIHKQLLESTVEVSLLNYLDHINQMIFNRSMYGEEAKFEKRTQYHTDWMIGDLFAHTMNNPHAERIGINGWTILFYKTGEYLDESGNTNQLMYVTLCPPGKEPTSLSELQKLGFLRLMCHDQKWDYLVQMKITSKRAEHSFQLKKTGNFRGIIPPSDSTVENPMVSMPMFGISPKQTQYPFYEEQICRLYKKYGRM